MSVQTTNMISKITLIGAFDTASCALAGAMLGNPVGAVAGALFGATRFFSQIPLVKGANHLLNANSPLADSAAKTLARAIRFFGSYGAAWGVLALAGFSLTIGHVITLALVGITCDFILLLFLSCNGIRVPQEVAV